MDPDGLGWMIISRAQIPFAQRFRSMRYDARRAQRDVGCVLGAAGTFTRAAGIFTWTAMTSCVCHLAEFFLVAVTAVRLQAMP